MTVSLFLKKRSMSNFFLIVELQPGEIGCVSDDGRRK
jgi:hypothetical protein